MTTTTTTISMAHPNRIRLLRGPPGALVVTSTLGAAGTRTSRRGLGHPMTFAQPGRPRRILRRRPDCYRRSPRRDGRALTVRDFCVNTSSRSGTSASPRCLFGALVLLNQINAFSGVDALIQEVASSKDAGVLAIFAIAVIGNTALLVQVPYTLPLLAVAAAGASAAHMAWLGLAAGVGAAIGGMISFLIAQKILARDPSIERGKLYRWVVRTTSERPRMASSGDLRRRVHTAARRRGDPPPRDDSLRRATVRAAALRRQDRPQRADRAALLPVHRVVGGEHADARCAPTSCWASCSRSCS